MTLFRETRGITPFPSAPSPEINVAEISPRDGSNEFHADPRIAIEEVLIQGDLVRRPTLLTRAERNLVGKQLHNRTRA